MILEILQDIKQACSSIADLKMIDLDRGQLDNPEAHESLLLPALLVDAPEIDWSELRYGNQTGENDFATKCIVHLPQHTAFYLNSEAENEHLMPLTSENLNALLIEDAIHQQMIKIPGVVRTRTKEYSSLLSGAEVWVVEHTYEQTVQYENIPRYVRKTIDTEPGINIILETE